LNSIALVTSLLAAAPAVPASQPAPAWFDALRNPLFILPGLLILWMMLSGNKGKRADEKKRIEMLKNLKRGDRIQTIGGVLGAVVRAEADRVEVKVDESSNVKIWFARNAISKVVVEGDKADAAK
jgi:preprotein translocase subunit YajC